MGLGKCQLLASFEVASFDRCRNIKGNPQILGSYLAQVHVHFLLWVGLYDGVKVRCEKMASCGII